MEDTSNKTRPERALLVGVDTGEYDAEASLQELWELAESSGAEPIAAKIQKRPSVEAATCVGSGMARELAEFCKTQEIDLLIFDRELTPIQIRNLEEICDTRVIDRTMLILDIFALRARTREGRLQVELAQLKYLLPRLTGKGVALSRLGGGIGTRGPGETKLETDRRHIRRRIESLKNALREVERSRAEIDRRRKKTGAVTVALVGYTNAGKSTLMNTLTDAGVLAEDKLFATLDPTTRALRLPCGKNVLLIDTVGFLRRLPHHLIEAFRSTLEQAASADVILNVCDASDPAAEEHLEVTEKLLEELGSADRPVIPVLNKWDRAEENPDGVPRVSGAVRISALHGDGIEELLRAVEEALPEKNREAMLLLPFSKNGVAARIRQEGTVLEEEYVPEGVKLRALIEPRLLEQVKEYLLPEPPNGEHAGQAEQPDHSEK